MAHTENMEDLRPAEPGACRHHPPDGLQPGFLQSVSRVGRRGRARTPRHQLDHRVHPHVVLRTLYGRRRCGVVFQRQNVTTCGVHTGRATIAWGSIRDPGQGTITIRLIKTDPAVMA